MIAVDGSRSMVERARAELPERVDVREADLLELELDAPVDAVLSTATFHWILDHPRLFARLHAALQAGGPARRAVRRRRQRRGGEAGRAGRGAGAAYAEHLRAGHRWQFATPEDTGAGCRRRVHRRLVLALARRCRPRRPGGLSARDLPGLVPRAAARGAAPGLRGGGARAAQGPARHPLRPAEHPRPARLRRNTRGVRDALIARCLDALPALLEDLVARTGDRAVAADVAAEAVAAVLAADDPERSLAVTADEVLARAQRRGEVPDAARRRMGMPPLDLSEAALGALPAPPEDGPAARPLLLAAGGPESDDLLADLAAQARAARHRPARRRVPLLAGAALVLVGVAAAVALAGGSDPAAPAAHAGDCPQLLSARLDRRVPALGAARVVPLPARARAVLDQRSWPVDHVQDGQAQLLSAEGELRFWACPSCRRAAAAHPRTARACSRPPRAVTRTRTGLGRSPADASRHPGGSSAGRPRHRRPGLQRDPRAPRRRVTGVPALGGVVATRVPQLPGFGGITEYQPQILPRVAVVDATGGDHDAVAGLLDDLREWGYPTALRVARGDPSLAPPEIRWRAGLTDRASAERLARHFGTSAVRRVADDHTGGAPLILVAGVG